jgi:hypothetical protein
LNNDSPVNKPSPGAELEYLGTQGTPVTLPNPRDLQFYGFSICLECLVAEIRAPLLEYLGITLSRQTASSLALPHLGHFITITEGLKLPTAQVWFDPHAVVISMEKHSTQWRIRHFSLEVRCRQLDRQIIHAAQIYRALIPALSGVEMLRLEVSLELSNPDTPMGGWTG